MSRSDLPQPLAPDRKWNAVHHDMYGVGYRLYDETRKAVCSLWRSYGNSGCWQVWIPDRPAWMTGRNVINLGPHGKPPFELAEAMADAAK